MKRDGIKAITLRPNHYELASLDALKNETGERTYSKAIMKAAQEYLHWRRRAETAEEIAEVLSAKLEDLCSMEQQRTEAEKLSIVMKDATESIRQAATLGLSVMNNTLNESRNQKVSDAIWLDPEIVRQAAKKFSERNKKMLRHAAAQGLSVRTNENTESIRQTAQRISERNKEITESIRQTAQRISQRNEEITESMRQTAQRISERNEEITESMRQAATLGLSAMNSGLNES